MLRHAAAGSSADGCPPGGRCLRSVSLIIFQQEFAIDPEESPVKDEAEALKHRDIQVSPDIQAVQADSGFH